MGLTAGGFAVGFFLAGLIPHEATSSEPKPSAAHQRAEGFPVATRDYSFGFWQNGLRKHKGDQSKDILCIETGHYGFALDIAAIDKARFGLIDKEADYRRALMAKDSRTQSLGPAELHVELHKDGKVYRAQRCKAAQERQEAKRMQSARLWESARYVQHYDLLGLELVSDQGEKLIADAKLDLVAWPQSLTINTQLEPVLALADGVQQGVTGKGLGVKNSSQSVAHQPGLEHEQFTLETWINVPKEYIYSNRSWIISKNKNGGEAGFFGIEIHGDRILGTVNIDGGGWKNRVTISTPRHTIIPNRWHHLAMSYNGKTIAIYVDGIRRDSLDINKKRILSTGEMRIGRLADNSGKSVNLIVDQVRMWNRALHHHELRKNAQNPAEIPNRSGLTYVNDFEGGPPLALPVWHNAKVRISLKNDKNHWQTVEDVTGEWTVGEAKLFSLECQLGQRNPHAEHVTVAMKHNGAIPATYRKDWGCIVAHINRPKRKGLSGYKDIRDYDEIDITVGAGKKGATPFMVEILRPANITGACPVLCDESGRPTGIPVQLAKNWHNAKLGEYIRLFTILPAAEVQKKYTLKIAYGFYGTLPSASHAQLSLVGYGGNGRWDQLAIGCWGETYCMDVDMSCTDVAVTDVRMLMTRAGEKGAMWSWTDAGWGGDWLGLSDANNKKLLFNNGKTAYLSHGPCMTEAQYDGYYGSQREVSYHTNVRTLRTDDFARTFTSIDYTFNKPVATDGWLFKMGRTGGYITPRIAYGNIDGLITEHVIPKGLKRDQVYLDRTTLQGSGPWWVAFPGARHYNIGSHIAGTGYRAMVIRSYKAVIDGKEHHKPTVKFPVYHLSPEGDAGLDFLLTAPEGVDGFKPGDRIQAEVEWITLPRLAEDYYGPNEAFRAHLAAKPSSWETTYREAKGNHLQVTVHGGTVIKNYPVIVRSEAPETKLHIKGGVGAVPVRFEGLGSAYGYKLYQIVDGKEIELNQAVHGNDFWQTDYDVATNSYMRTYNIQLDGMPESHWILKPFAKPHQSTQSAPQQQASPANAEAPAN